MFSPKNSSCDSYSTLFSIFHRKTAEVRNSGQAKVVSHYYYSLLFFVTIDGLQAG